VPSCLCGFFQSRSIDAAKRITRQQKRVINNCQGLNVPKGRKKKLVCPVLLKPISQSNGFILACLISGSITASEKITPLSFRQIFFKILQSEGTLKNVPLASLILILKPIITFAEQGQNEVTLKNAPGWGKRIQLDIGNLNQISGRTEETLGRGEESLEKGEETLGSGEDLFLKRNNKTKSKSPPLAL